MSWREPLSPEDADIMYQQEQYLDAKTRWDERNQRLAGQDGSCVICQPGHCLGQKDGQQ